MRKEINKIQVPNVECKYVNRKVDFLLTSLKTPMVILNAGAGYGKTQVLANYVTHCDQKSAWYSLGDTDNDLIPFVRNITKSVQCALGSKEGAFRASVSRNKEVDSLMESLVLWLDERVERLNLILDDFQEIHNQDIFNLINVLVETMGEKIRFFVVEKGSLPEFLQNYVKSGMATCIGAKELEFTKIEIEQVLKHTIEADLLAQAAELIYSCTEGWPVGVTQILLNLKQQRKKINIATVKRICETLEISNYIMTSVYEFLPFELQIFLKKTAVLDYMTAPICNQVVGTGNADNLLKYLVNEKLFVESLGGESEMYRYHSVFQRFLLSLVSENEQREVLKKAALYLLKTDNKIQAAEYGCRAKSVDVVQAVIEVSGEDILKERLYDVIKRWFEFLFGQNQELTPKSRFVYGKYLWLLDQKVQAREQIMMASKAFRAEGKMQEYEKVLLFMASLERRAGNLKQAQLFVRQMQKEREGQWSDIAEELCLEKVKCACCLQKIDEAMETITFWKGRGVRLQKGTFLFEADRIFSDKEKIRNQEVYLMNLEDEFLLKNCILAECMRAAYREGDQEQILYSASIIIQNSEYETLQTVIAWKMKAILSWENEDYQKAIEQAKKGNEFLEKNQIQLHCFDQKHRQVLDKIDSLKKITVDSRRFLLQERVVGISEKEPPQKIRIQCMKRFRVLFPGEDEKEVKWRTKKAKELFAYLFHLQGGSVSREELVEVLWPETGLKSAAALFHTTLYSVRQTFVQEGWGELIVCENRKYFMNMKMVYSDLEELMKILRNKRESGPLLFGYSGSYMGDTGYIWAYGRAKKLENSYLQMCRDEAIKRIQDKQEELAIPFLQRMLEIEFYDEEIAVCLIRCLYSTGKRKEAKEQYDHMVELYKEELGLKFQKTFQGLLER